MTKLSLIAGLALAALAAPAFAGDAAKGENEFKKCKACHSLIADDGTAIVKGGATGPNLYGIIGRTLGTGQIGGKDAADKKEFKYGASIVAAGAAGAVWDEAKIAEYVADPTAFLKKTLAADDAKSNMSFKLASGGEDVAAYLASLKPAQ